MKLTIDIADSAQKLANFLISSKHMLVTAESCTGGGVAQVLTDISGSSNWFDRGFITYSSVSKTEILGINPDIIMQYGVVSHQVASAMAAGALDQCFAEYSIAITGIAGPTGGSIEKPVGTVYIAVQKRNQPAIVVLENFNGNRVEVRLQAILKALQLIPSNYAE